MYLALYFKVTWRPDPWIQSPRPEIIGMKHFLKTDLMLDCSLSNACLHAAWIAPPTPPWPRASEFCSSVWARGCSLLFLSDSCKSSLTECKIVAKLLRSVNSVVIVGYQFCLTFPTGGQGSLQSNTLGHLNTISGWKWGCSYTLKAIIRTLRGNWIRTVGLAIVYLTRLCLVLFRNLPPFSLPLFLEWNAFEVIYEMSNPGAGRRQWIYGSSELILILTFSLATFRQRTCQYLGL